MVGPSFYVVQVVVGIEFVEVSVVKSVPDMADLVLVFEVQPEDLFATVEGEVVVDVVAEPVELAFEAVGEVLAEEDLGQLLQLVAESMLVVVGNLPRQPRWVVHPVLVYLASHSGKVGSMQPFEGLVVARLQ